MLPDFAIVFAVRLVSAFTQATFFQPDEFFQAWEPAYKNVYGRGYSTWEWQQGVRSRLMPQLYALLFRLSDKWGVDVELFISLFHALVAVSGDFFVYKLARRFTNENTARKALWLNVGSAFNWIIATRSFSNTYEMVLTTAALWFWPADAKSLKGYKAWLKYFASIVLANIAIILRPSNAITWLFLAMRFVFLSYRQPVKVFFAAFFGSAIIVVLHLYNWIQELSYHKSFVFPILKFWSVNIKDNIGIFYGSMPWHFYLTQGIPMLLAVYTPFALMGLKKLGLRSVITQVVIVNVLTFSFIEHKEARFLYFLVPLLHIAVATVVKKRVIRILVLINIPLALYFSQVHQRGAMEVIKYIRNTPDISEVAFLTPCHSTPLHSHIRRDIEADFLTCEPKVNNKTPSSSRSGTTSKKGKKISKPKYLDEADRFYRDPVRFLKTHPYFLPHTIVIFDSLRPVIEELLDEKEYKEVARFFNSHYHPDWRRRGDLVVLSRPGTLADDGIKRPKRADAPTFMDKLSSLSNQLSGMLEDPSVSEELQKILNKAPPAPQAV